LLSPIGRSLTPTGNTPVSVAAQPSTEIAGTELTGSGRIVLQLVISPADSPLADIDFTFHWTPAPIGEWGSPIGDAPGAFAMPNGVAIAPDGTVYAADSANHRVQKFTASGAFLGQIGATGSPGAQPGAFNFPAGVAVDGAGMLYVADFF